MLHEVLLSLSGHPSPIFDTDKQSLLSPQEAALLSNIGKLAKRHRELRGRAESHVTCPLPRCDVAILTYL